MYQSTIRNPRRTSKGKIVSDYDCHHQYVYHYARPQSKLCTYLFQIPLETVKILLFIELFIVHKWKIIHELSLKMKLTIHNQYPFLTSIRLFWPDTKLPLHLTWRNGHPGLWSSKKSVISSWLYTPHSTLWHTVGISCGSISSWDVGSLCLVSLHTYLFILAEGKLLWQIQIVVWYLHITNRIVLRWGKVKYSVEAISCPFSL